MFPGGTHAHRSDKPETLKYHNHSFMRLKTLMLTALAAGTLLTACQADDIPGPDAKELYTRDFIKKFGAFDPNHDWNMATQAGITVTSARPADIKVYADVSSSAHSRVSPAPALSMSTSPRAPTASSSRPMDAPTRSHPAPRSPSTRGSSPRMALTECFHGASPGSECSRPPVLTSS